MTQARQLGASPLLEPSDFDAAAEVTGLASHVEHVSNSRVRIHLDVAALNSALEDRSVTRWQFRVLATAADSLTGYTGFNSGRPGTVSQLQLPLLRLTLEPDACPDDPNKMKPGICGCGTSDADTDGDGTVDCIDEVSGCLSLRWRRLPLLSRSHHRRLPFPVPTFCCQGCARRVRLLRHRRRQQRQRHH